jgi:8-oxo-dGTP pyrophosphatase MutT (NUDIX family)
VSGLTRAAVAERLSGRLLRPRVAMSLSVRGATDAAVLVALYVDGGVLHAVLTKRREDMRRHPGEISFPGGRAEDDDADLLATALRETDEEIGLPAGQVQVLGALQPTPTIATGYAVYPFVGLIEPSRAWTLSPREVDRVLELPIDELRAGHGRRGLLRRGLPIRTETYVVGEDLIWGATARILDDLLLRLG